MIHLQRLNHIQICIPKGKENEARKFYTDILGLIEIPKPQPLRKNGGLWYQLNDIQIHIGVEEELNKTKQHPAFEVKHIERVKQYLQFKGIQIKENIAIDGIKRFDCFDPFGNRIELMEKVNESASEIEQFWNNFVAKNPQYENLKMPPTDYFCDSKASADECAALVQNGIKTATCGALFDYEANGEHVPEVGDLWIITDWDGNPKCIIKTTKIKIQKFSEVDAEFAKQEGEGDLSYEYWRKVHWEFFGRALAKYGLEPSENMLLVCENFERID